MINIIKSQNNLDKEKDETIFIEDDFKNLKCNYTCYISTFNRLIEFN